MKTIEIPEEFKNTDDAINALRYIADLIERGYMRGYEPEWCLSGEDEEDVEDTEAWLGNFADNPFSTPEQD